MNVTMGWLVGVLMFFSTSIMAQNGRNYKQQFSPSAKKEKVEQQKYCGTIEDENQFSKSHNYKDNFSKPGESSAIIEYSDGANNESYSKSERDSSFQESECDLSGKAYTEQNYKKTFPGREK